MAEKYTAAVIGCGNMSHSHARQYHALENVDFIACSDINPEAMKRYEERYGVTRHYTDYEELLAKESPDLVSICTWVELHPTITIACAKAGVKGIICEKPMAISMPLAREMLDACDAAGTKLAIGHQLRFSGRYVAAKRLLAEGAIGELVKIHGLCAGGDLMDNATHTVDLMNWFADDSRVEWVMGQIERGNAGLKFGIAATQDALGYWKHENGVRCFLEAGSFTAPGYHHFYLYGTDGELELSVPDGPELRYRSASTAGQWATTELRSDSAPVRDLIEAIEEDREPRSSGRNGLAALEILLGIMESSRRRGLVRFPLDVDGYPLQEMIDAGEI